MSLLNVTNMKALERSLSSPAKDGEREVLREDAFRRRIALERKRTERSREPFLLMLLEESEPQSPEKQAKLLERVVEALAPGTRETDSIGWYEEGTAVGILFTGLVDEEKLASRTIILNRVTTRLREELPDN